MNIANEITNPDFVAVLLDMAKETWAKLKEELTPGSLNLKADGRVLREEDVDKYKTKDGKWIPKKN